MPNLFPNGVDKGSPAEADTGRLTDADIGAIAIAINLDVVQDLGS
jgi:hypothetical protein